MESLHVYKFWRNGSITGTHWISKRPSKTRSISVMIQCLSYVVGRRVIHCSNDGSCGLTLFDSILIRGQRTSSLRSPYGLCLTWPQTQSDLSKSRKLDESEDCIKEILDDYVPKWKDTYLKPLCNRERSIHLGYSRNEGPVSSSNKVDFYQHKKSIIFK